MSVVRLRPVRGGTGRRGGGTASEGGTGRWSGGGMLQVDSLSVNKLFVIPRLVTPTACEHSVREPLMSKAKNFCFKKKLFRHNTFGT